jgi:hypothetical protein
MKARKKTTKKLNGFVKDTRLDKYKDIVLFPEKVKKATEILKTAGIPKT